MLVVSGALRFFVFQLLCSLRGHKIDLVSEREHASHEELVRFLEEQSGRSIRSREDVRAYLAELVERKAGSGPLARFWLKAKQATLFGLLAFAFVQYYLFDVFVQILTVRENIYFVPVIEKASKPKPLERV